MITNICKIEDFRPDNDIIIGLRNKKSLHPNIRELKIIFDKIYLNCQSEVKCYISEPCNIQLWFSCEGKFSDCLTEIEKDYEIFCFKKYDDFHNWYLNAKRSN